MGMCIVHFAVPAGSDPNIELGEDYEPQLVHGRAGPIALAVVMAPDHARDRLREVGRSMEWGALLPGRTDTLPVIDDLAFAALTGAPPARCVGGVGRRAVFDRAAVGAVASALGAIDEGELRVSYRRERAHVPSHVDEEMLVRMHATLRNFFASARNAGRDVILEWQYR